MGIRKEILEMSPYKPPLEGRSREYLLCDFNERIEPLSSKVAEAITARLGDLQIYPAYAGFTERVAKYAGVQPDQVLTTNGSDQGIELITRASCSRGDEVILPVPSFAYYRQVAGVEGLTMMTVRYNDDYSFPVQGVLDAITAKTALIFVANPNNPTGTSISRADILEIARRAPNATILVDECYFEYTNETVADAVGDQKNLFITRTFSKTWGLASLRIGYIITSRENVAELNKIRGPYDVNQLSTIAAAAALENQAAMQDYVDEVLTISKPLFESYLEKKGVRFVRGSANFVLTFHADPARIVSELQKQSILVRPQHGPMLDGAVRISLGRKKDTERLIAALDKIL